MSDVADLLIVEDDKRLAHLIQDYLVRHGFNVSVVHDGESALDFCRQHTPAVVILDLMLPGIDGISVCRDLRTHYRGRILMLTASRSDVDQVVGLEVGADDYVIKPTEPRVLLARIRALIRRSGDGRPTLTASSTLVFGALIVDDEAKSVTFDGNPIKLTTQEFELLWLLASHAGRVLNRDEIFTHLRGSGYDGTDRAVDVKISRLRRKLADDGNEPQRIKTVWGRGYLFVPTAWGRP